MSQGLLLRVVPMGSYAGRARAVVERSALVNRRNWLLVASGVVEPLFYLFALGIGFGAIVGQQAAPDGRPISYAAYVAPGLLAASAMNGAIHDSTFNIFLKLKHARVYDAMLATPLGPMDVALGETSWALLRGGIYAAGFLAVMAALGLVASPWAVLALPAALLIAFGFAAVGMAAATLMRSWQDFDLVLLVQMPMFLFSTTFYPITVYPGAIRILVECLPLYHGIELMRQLSSGAVSWGILGHIGYFAIMVVVGAWLATRRLGTLLLT
ncbi:ABC transporter permease [Kutzneria sp. NPDC052558]|uniref:ABC transporter permease n=1 Tax=Kutzneria sp. NPDC052558 TaxID=3364121 RepID=UPI0037C729C7